jgi:hypothetical protein
MIFIPTYNPDIKLLKNLDKLVSIYPAAKIAVVNDGSSNKKSFIILKEIKKKFKNIKLINLKKNYGKGYAIKKCLKYCKDKKINYALFVDDDGQHGLDDIKKFLNSYSSANVLVIGKRNTSINKLSDTQCGLRLIPKKFFNFGINLESNKYDFEYEFLLKYSLYKNLKTVPIKTIYFKQNINSKFKKIKDSYLVLNIVFSKIYPSSFIFISDLFLFTFLNLLSFNFFLSGFFSKLVSGSFILFKLKKINILNKKNFLILVNILLSFTLMNYLFDQNILQNILLYFILNIYFSIVNFRLLNKI